jgi:DDE superfamily endonuclease
VSALRVVWVTASWVFDGPINAECFFQYVEQVLVSCLEQGYIVVIDNLGSYKAEAKRLAISKAVAKLLFLPPYSPDLYQIDQNFSKINMCCTNPRDDQFVPSKMPSQKSCQQSLKTNARTTPGMQDMPPI